MQEEEKNRKLILTQKIVTLSQYLPSEPLILFKFKKSKSSILKQSWKSL